MQEILIQAVPVFIDLPAQALSHPAHGQSMRKTSLRQYQVGQGQHLFRFPDIQPGQPMGEPRKILGCVRIQQNSLIPDSHLKVFLPFQQGLEASLAVMGQNGWNQGCRDQRRMPAQSVKTGMKDGLTGKGCA